MSDDEMQDSVEALTLLMREMLVEMRKISHPAFEALLLEQLRVELLKQHRAGEESRKLHRELHDTTQGLKSYVGELVNVLRKYGIPCSDLFIGGGG